MPLRNAADASCLALLVAACASPRALWPATVVFVDHMRALVPLRTRVEYRRRDGPPAGVVVLRMHVDETGQVQRSAVLESSGHANPDEAALHAARTARFVPHRIDGVATAVTVVAPMHFGAPTRAKGTVAP